MLTVDKATLTVKADPNQRTYGDTEDPEFTIRYFGFFNNDAEEGTTNISGLDGVSGSASAAGTADRFSNAGSDQTIDVDVSTLSSTNYSFTDDDTGVLTINKETLTVSAVNTNRIYGTLKDPSEINFSYAGFKNDDAVDGTTDISRLAGIIGIDGVTGEFGDTDVVTAIANSTHDINVTEVSTLESTNYLFVASTMPGVLTVDKETLTVSAVNTNRIYGTLKDPFEITFSYDGFKNGDAVDGTTDISGLEGITGIDGVKGEFGDTDVVTAIANSTHDINVTEVSTLESTNYLFVASSIPGVLTVDKARLRVYAVDTERCEKTVTPSIPIEYEESDFKNNENRSVILQDPEGYVPNDNINLAPDLYDIFLRNGLDENYRFDFSENEGQLTIYAETKVIDQETAISACVRDEVLIGASVESDLELTYQWQMQTSSSSPFEDISQDDNRFSNVTNDTLQINSIIQEMSGYQFRLISSTRLCQDNQSNPISLTVLDTPPFAFIKRKAFNVLVNTDSTSDATYSWGIGNNIVPGANKKFHQFDHQLPNDLSQYWSEACNSNGCCTRSYYGQIPEPPEPSEPDQYNPRLVGNLIQNNFFDVEFDISVTPSPITRVYNQSGILRYELNGEIQSSRSTFTLRYTFDQRPMRGLYFIVIELPDGFVFKERLIIN